MEPLARLIEQRPLILAFWVFVVGGAIGSFLNVVAYRLPRGQSLSYPGSRCPRCGHPIRWYHNLPMAGWLILRGRCFDCGGRVSPRYPAVELAVATLFVGLAYGLVWRPWMNSPAFGESSGHQFLLRLLGSWACAAAAWSAAAAAGLVTLDGNRIPRTVSIVGLACAAGAAAATPPGAASWGHIAGGGAGLALVWLMVKRRAAGRSDGPAARRD